MMLERRAIDARERMDSPDCDASTLRRTYQQFSAVNKAFAGWRTVYSRFLRPRLSRENATTLLDLGCGGGDVALHLAGLARQGGLKLSITAVDPDPRAMEYAMNRPARDGVTFRRASGADLVQEGASFDVVISNHVLHHLDHREFQAFLQESEKLSTRLVLHNDLRRHPAAFALFGLAALPLRGSFIREDGLTSIRRSYTATELAMVSPPSWQVVPLRPFRQLLVYSHTSAAETHD